MTHTDAVRAPSGRYDGTPLALVLSSYRGGARSQLKCEMLQRRLRRRGLENMFLNEVGGGMNSFQHAEPPLGKKKKSKTFFFVPQLKNG